MTRKLKQLIWCDICRDGGSLCGEWVDDENKEWYVTLRINRLNKLNEIRTYKLFNCHINDTNNHSQIVKDSIQHIEINNLIKNWIIDYQIDIETLKKEKLNHERLYDLLQKLKEGNY